MAKRVLITNIKKALTDGATSSEVNAVIQQHIDDFNLTVTVAEWRASKADLFSKYTDRDERDNDTLLTNIKSKTPQQAADWVETNVTSLATAKTVLKAYAKAISYLLRNMDD